MIYIAGPCGFENYEMAEKTIKFLTEKGIKYIRGGAEKYRSNPKDYQGSHDIFYWIKELKKKYTFKYVCEIFNVNQLIQNHDIIDIVQIGSRSMYNTDLLKHINMLSETNILKKPILFKRHYCASLQEFVNHSNYLKDCEVIMCLRGKQSLHPQEQRFTPDVTDIPRLREMTDKKICYDISHSACDKKYVEGLYKAAKTYKPNYIMVEVHPEPEKALSDAQQQLNFKEFERMTGKGE